MTAAAPESGNLIGVKRLVLNLLIAMSFVLCVAAIALWVRSYDGADSISRLQVTGVSATSSTSRIREIQCTHGQLRFLLTDAMLFTHRPTTTTSYDPRPHWTYFRYGEGYFGESAPPTRSIWNRLGFGAWQGGSFSSFSSTQQRVWAAPLWLPASLLALPPVLWLLRTYSRRRHQTHGRCPSCGYDLRATPERCPECGTIPSSVKGVAT